MKYTVEVQIKRPKEKVFKLFENPENLYNWQPTLKKVEHFNGIKGQPGAKTKLTYLKDGKPYEMIETITNVSGTDEFRGTYGAKGARNDIKSTFFDENGNTKLVLHNDFKFSGFTVLISFFIKGMFVKQTTSMLNNFKKFAESSIN